MKLKLPTPAALHRPSELVLAAGVAAILAFLVIPLPAAVLDVCLALNLAASVALLVTALYASQPLQLASFPTLLLLTTLFRLSLNVSSTRLALSDGHAGEVIDAFGEFVVRGDYVVGLVVFAILTLVQFLVVAKGAERVAEVSARFTLDAMPGKQMSIDADLRAGAIDQKEARRRRRQLERESQLFGAMDGAMKFVKGDVIAGLIIVFVNLLGGTVIGVLRGGMDFGDAASTFALIAIGDGLVSQLPSLCVTVAAGIVVTRVASEQEGTGLGDDIGQQFFGSVRVLSLVGALCLVLALIPGMPRAPFALVATACGVGAFFIARRRSRQAVEQSERAGEKEPAKEASVEPLAEALPLGVSPITLDLAPDLTSWITLDSGRFLKVDLERVRESVFFELGVKIPGVNVRTGATYLPPGGYAILIDEVPAARGVLSGEGLYAQASPSELAFLEVEATPLQDPATGQALSLVPNAAREKLVAAQVPLRDARQLAAQHLGHVLRRRADAFLGVHEVQSLVEGFEAKAPALVKEALAKVPVPLLSDVLRRLVREGVTVRDLKRILEVLVSPQTEGDAAALTERCRQGLSRYLSHKYAPAGPLYAYLVDPEIEETLRQSGPRGEAADPAKISKILGGVRQLAAAGRTVLIASPDVRRSLRRLCEGGFPEVAVLTYAELEPDLQIRPLGKLAA